MSKRIHKNQLITNQFIKVNKILLENPHYEKLSEGAILTYSILRDRLNLSEQNPETYADENGFIYVIYTDKELAEIIHRTPQTANARKKELEKFGLLEMVRMGNKEANRIYLCEPNYCDPSEYLTERFREKRQAEKAKQRKEAFEKALNKKFILTEIEDDNESSESYPQASSLGAVMKSKNLITCDQKSISRDIKNFDAIHTDLIQTDLNQTEIYEEEAAAHVENSSSENINILFPALIQDLLGSEGVYDKVMLARIIIEMKKENINFFTKKEMLDQHHKMIKKQNVGEDIWDWAKYFVGGILKNRLSENTAITQNRLTETKKFNEYSKQVNKDNAPPVSFYNWLES